MSAILGIDPGNAESAGVLLTPEGRIHMHCKLPNAEFLLWCQRRGLGLECRVVCEMIASYGMPVGREVFETCVFIGELKAALPGMQRVTRIQVKSALCHSARATDANVRQALLDIYGPPGTKRAQGATYGIAGDVWAALAVATVAARGCNLYNPHPEGAA